MLEPDDVTLYSARGSALECYICATGPPASRARLLSVCQCSGRYIHLACQQRLVDQSQSLECSVCKVRYNNVETERIRFRFGWFRFTWEGKLYIIMFLAILVLLSLSIHQIVAAFTETSGRHGIFMFVAGCFFFLVVVFASSFLTNMRPKVIIRWSKAGIKLHDRPIQTVTSPAPTPTPLPPPSTHMAEAAPLDAMSA